MAETHLAVIRFVFQTIGAGPKLIEKLRTARGRPSAKDREALVAYCRRLNERRVFSAPFRDEIAESCLTSLTEVKAFTEDALSRVSHPTSQAALGAILDDVRSLLDKWHGTRTPRDPLERNPYRDRPSREADFLQFLQCLGALRQKMRTLVGMLELIEPKATAPRLHDDARRESDT